MLGVAWPEMRISFQQPISAAGLVPPLGVAATLISTTSSSHLLHQIGLGRLLAASSLLSAVALAGSAASQALIGLAMGVSVGAFAPAIAPLCLTAAFLHVAMQMRRRR